MYIQVDAQENDPTSFVFQSEDAPTKEKLMVLIHGTGVVRAGQWARRLLEHSGTSHKGHSE